MARKMWLPELHEYREYDGGRLILRRLGPRRYIGLRLPEFTSVRGKSVDVVLRRYDSRPKRKVEHRPHKAPPTAAELRMAREFLTRPWPQ